MSAAAIKVAQEAMVAAEQTENNVKHNADEAMRLSNEAVKKSAEVEKASKIDQKP